MTKTIFRHLLLATAACALAGCGAIQRQFLFFPTHHHESNGLAEWRIDGAIVGYSRLVGRPANVWLMLHGNGGQAADRAYALHAFDPADAVFILEYPGYGQRPGAPSRAAFDAAAQQAYRWLRAAYRDRPVCVAGESIGSGPACVLAGEAMPPDKLVLVVPFDELKLVAKEHLPYAPVGLVLGDAWNNRQALAGFKRPVEIFGAAQDNVIPVTHARALAASVPSAQFHLLRGGHNDWSDQPEVHFHNP